tara:strand:- start:598 stop:900 length:303 start_codon:yes stop_codon:yes gene_type:complete
MTKKQPRLSRISITAMIDQFNQYELGNVTNEGLLDSLLSVQEELSKDMRRLHVANAWIEDPAVQDFLNDPANNKEPHEMGDTHKYIQGGLTTPRKEGDDQ